MKLYSYQESNTPYYCVSFSTGKLSVLELKQIEKWCFDTYGPGLGEWRLENSPFTHRWINDVKYGEVRFIDEKDMLLFVLKWT